MSLAGLKVSMEAGGGVWEAEAPRWGCSGNTFHSLRGSQRSCASGVPRNILSPLTGISCWSLDCRFCSIVGGVSKDIMEHPFGLNCVSLWAVVLLKQTSAFNSEALWEETDKQLYSYRLWPLMVLPFVRHPSLLSFCAKQLVFLEFPKLSYTEEESQLQNFKLVIFHLTPKFNFKETS